ncbi:plasminogen receptor (KT) [Anoplophora glabripennis]|uniref:plasminogen receptor (KT) n=1 Tax=Anoplophora glabripennis TaxID=217634 RepID=UPI0008744840|nr:plasminogen receptor (KT) [Anoplophora glabripennis]
MGNTFTINMEENFRRNQEFITEMNTIKIERQLQMRNQMREREVALQIAKSRELFFWYGAFYLTSVAWALTSYRYKRKPIYLASLVPLTFVVAYQADLAYGNKLHRIIVEAEHILQFENDLLALPLGVPTASSIDLKRLQNDEQKKLHPVLPAI